MNSHACLTFMYTLLEKPQIFIIIALYGQPKNSIVWMGSLLVFDQRYLKLVGFVTD